MKKHGMSNTPIYNAWVNMKSRCNNKNVKAYKNYGGRGIVYTKKWEDFQGFIEEMGDTYKEGLTLERIDNDKGYSKENCKWVPFKKQQRNKRNNVWVTYKGETKTISEWSRVTGINTQTLSRRLQRGVKPPYLFQKVKKGGRINEDLADD
jgi:Fic family protein